jgi:hypothetical protein
MDRAMKCETDGMSSTDTPGYFGHLELAKPVFHHGFIKNVVSVLRCVGFSSSKLMIDKVRSDERDATSEAIFPSRSPRARPPRLRRGRERRGARDRLRANARSTRDGSHGGMRRDRAEARRSAARDPAIQPPPPSPDGKTAPLVRSLTRAPPRVFSTLNWN